MEKKSKESKKNREKKADDLLCWVVYGDEERVASNQDDMTYQHRRHCALPEAAGPLQPTPAPEEE